MSGDFATEELCQLEEGFPAQASAAFAAAAQRTRQAGIPVLEARGGRLVEVKGTQIRVICEIARPVAVTKRRYQLR